MYTSDALLTGNFDFYDSFTLKAIVGASNTSDEYRYSSMRANNLSIPGFYDISNGTGSLDGTVDQYEKKTYGVYGDFTLGYNNYIFLSFSGRNDWTSTLSEENRSYFYPSVGLSFVATDAFEVLKTGNILTTAKITASNATVYNDLSPYQISEVYSQSGSFPFGDINGFYLQGAAVDENIKKEKLNTTELGLNLGFLNGKIWLDFAWYRTLTTDLITYTTPSIASASSDYLTNIGELEGSGIELTLGGSVIRTEDFRWDLSLNYSSSETVVNEIYEGLDEIAVATTGQYGVYAVVGEAFPQMKANIYQRDPQGRIIIDPSTGWPLEADGLHNLGKTTPDYIVGLTSTLSYKGISLSGTIDYRTGHVYYEQGSDMMEFTGRSIASVSANRQDFVIPNSVYETDPGVYVDNTNIPVSQGRQSYWSDVYNNVKSNYVKDATALKVRELTVNYELPESLLENIPLKKVVVGFIARNPLTWLPEENRFADPEFNNQYNNSNTIGIGGYMQAPPTKSYGFSINIEF